MSRGMGNKGVSLTELILYGALMSVVISIMAAVLTILQHRFLVLNEKSQTEYEVLNLTYNLRRTFGLASSLQTIADTANFFQPATLSEGFIAAGGGTPFDSANIDASVVPGNQGQYYAIARFQQEHSRGPGLSEFYATAIYFKTPDVNGQTPFQRAGAVVIKTAGPPGANNIDLAPSESDLTFTGLSRFRIKEFELYPGTDRVLSVTFEITARYFTTRTGRRHFWSQSPPPADTGGYAEIVRDVGVVVRNNLLEVQGGLTLLGGEIRPYQGLYFFRPVAAFDINL